MYRDWPTSFTSGITMNYTKYFKSGQDVLLLNVSEDFSQRTESLTGSVVRATDDFFDVALPYSSADTGEIPFDRGTRFCLLANVLGLGIQVNGELSDILSPSVVRIKPVGNMEVFGRRKFIRANVTIGIHCKRGAGTLRTYRSQWQAAMKSVAAGTAFPPGFSPARIEVNLSAGGISMHLSPPASMAELCLMLLELGDGQPPVITLCEVVWVEIDSAGKQLAGLRFIEVMKADQERLNAIVIEELKKQGQDVQWQNQRVELLSKMHF